MRTRFLVILSFLIQLLQRFSFNSSSMMIAYSSSNVTCNERERQSLLAIKQSLEDRYNRLSTWRGVECCEWKGVGCDTQNGHVVKLDLHGILFSDGSCDKCLEGKLSPWLEDLKQLRYLDLSANNVSGNIPEFLGSFKHLEYLNLSNSGLVGVVPHHLGNLSRLQYLDIRNYFVDKAYPPTSSRLFFQEMKAPTPVINDLGWVSRLSSLRHLDLSGITIGRHVDWFHQVNMLPSLLTLNLALSEINLPSSKFVNCTSLKSLDLSSNNISSTIPMWLSNLTLMHLNLEDNNFHGKIPDFLGLSGALVSIDLSFNSFDTSMPDQFSNLSSLVHLRLSYNKFSGPIPTNIGQLSRLENLRLQGNQLSGNIPTSLGQLSNLKYLDLSNNSLVGRLSETHLEKLTNLYRLDLSLNSLELNFNSEWAPPFQLQKFYARSCKIGPRFPNWLQTQTNLQLLDLSNSNIKDTIPEWFENILSNMSYVELSNNQIGGKLPRFQGDSSFQTGDLRFLRMSSNKFEGTIAIIPSNVWVLDLSDNLLSGYLPHIDRGKNPNLDIINLSKNRFTGSIAPQLCKVHSIRVLHLSQNKFSGRLPTFLGYLINLVVLDLADNAITGVVPSSLGSLNSLNSLHLQNNIFEGDIPVSLQNLTKLFNMDFGNNLFMGNIPFWIGEKLSALRFLNLGSNKFTGKIPLQLCQLSDLQYLNLANNRITGTIPRCFGNLSALRITTPREYNDYTIGWYEENILASMKGRQSLYTKTARFLTSLDLSSNNIVGEIPDALMNLVLLNNLNLSRNLLQGQIPMIIGNLNQLESIDLSMNKPSGRIPQSLTSLNFLSYLNLSFNNLSGAIPIGNQIQTLDDPSIYEGNNGLCGPLIQRSCYENEASHNHADEDEGKDDSEGFWFYAGIGPGFVVGLLGLLGSLHFIRSWRVAYFEMLENVYGWLVVSILLLLTRLRRKIFK